jgi:hypothetical protein
VATFTRRLRDPSVSERRQTLSSAAIYSLNGTPTCGALNMGAEDKYFLMRSNASCYSAPGEFNIIFKPKDRGEGINLPARLVSAFRPRGIPGPTSKLSLRVLAQMGRRETGHKGGRTVKGKPRPSCCPAPRADGCACSRGLQAFAWERASASALCAGPFSRAANLPVREPWTFLL